VSGIDIVDIISAACITIVLASAIAKAFTGGEP
jgi:hypothetical protein